jgi:hypothetical protein
LNTKFRGSIDGGSSEAKVSISLIDDGQLAQVRNNCSRGAAFKLSHNKFLAIML